MVFVKKGYYNEPRPGFPVCRFGVVQSTCGIQGAGAFGRIMTWRLAASGRPVLCCGFSQQRASCAVSALNRIIFRHDLFAPDSSQRLLDDERGGLSGQAVGEVLLV